MGRIKIEDLPKDHKFSKEEMKKVLGGDSLFKVYGVKYELLETDYSQLHTNLHRIVKTIGDTMKTGAATPSGL